MTLEQIAIVAALVVERIVGVLQQFAVQPDGREGAGIERPRFSPKEVAFYLAASHSPFATGTKRE